MGDVAVIYQELQKACQKEEIAIHDVMTYRDVALKKLELMRVDPYPGELKEKHLETNDKPEGTGRNVVNALVTSFKRDATAIRGEIIAAARNFRLRQCQLTDSTRGSSQTRFCQTSIT